MRKTFVIIAVLLNAFMAQSVMAADVVVIANNNVPEGSLDKGTMEKIFLGKKSQWSDGSKVVPVMMKSGAAHDAFLSGVLGKTSAQFNNFWNQAMFTGKGTPPKSFTSEADLVSYVASTSGAVGYVSKGTATSGVKVLTVN